MADTFLQDLAGLTGLTHYPKQGPFEQKEGSLIGSKDGFLVVVGPSRAEGGQSAVSVVLRFKKLSGTSALEAALQGNPALKGMGKAAKIEEDRVRWDWGYAFRKPKAEDVARLLESLLEAVKQAASPFTEKCESCDSSSAPQIVLLEGTPVHFCESCQQKFQMELDAAGQAYEEMSSNLPNGVLLGTVAAAGGGVAWGLVAYYLQRIFLWGAILIGYVVAQAVVKGMGKVTLAGQVIVCVLTIASVFFGDTVFFTLALMRELKQPFSMDLLQLVVANFRELEMESGGGVATFIFALAGAGYALRVTRKPKFKVKFERLGQPPT